MVLGRVSLPPKRRYNCAGGNMRASLLSPIRWFSAAVLLAGGAQMHGCSEGTVGDIGTGTGGNTTGAGTGGASGGGTGAGGATATGGAGANGTGTGGGPTA